MAARAGSRTVLRLPSGGNGATLHRKVQRLQGEGPFTLFAPTNEAFASLSDATIQVLFANPEVLNAILLYHVVDGEVRSGDLADGLEAPTLHGEMVSFTINDEKTAVNEANIILLSIVIT